MDVVMDGVTYNVNVKIDSFKESFRIADGVNAGVSILGSDIRDILGTYFDHEMAVEPTLDNWEDYTAFYNALCQPVASRVITVPHGQGLITYNAKVLSGVQTLRKKIGSFYLYTGFVVQFKATAPQITAV